MQWGRNDQAVTANSTTTKETSNGAPIGTYVLVKGSGGGVSPVSMDSNAHFGNTSGGSRANVDVGMFNSQTPGAYITNMATGIFGVSATEISNNINNNSGEMPAHAGWVYRKAFTGPIVTVGYTGTATGYNNTDIITVSSPQAGGNASVSLTTNATGGSLVLKITNAGAGFLAVNATPNVAITNATGGSTSGTGATFFAYAGGRAGRVHTETLVATGSLGAQTGPQAGVAPALVNDSSTDNPEYPGV